MLAYVTALWDCRAECSSTPKDEDEIESVTHEVRHSGKRLEVAALDLSGTLEDTLDRVDQLAHRIRGLRRSRIASTVRDDGMPVFRVPANANVITSADVYESLDEWP